MNTNELTTYLKDKRLRYTIDNDKMTAGYKPYNPVLLASNKAKIEEIDDILQLLKK